MTPPLRFAMDFAAIIAASLFAAALTLFSGFGLGSLLMPVFAVFVPVEAAIAMTAVVHLANNLFAVALLRKDADWRLVAWFTLIAVPAALLGAALLSSLGAVRPLGTYALGERECTITATKLVVALVVGSFAALELTDVVNDRPSPSVAPERRRRWISLGAAISGFFGGLTGHQGAVRAAFLVRSGLTKESFIATGKVSAVAIDIARLAIYALAAWGGADWARSIGGGGGGGGGGLANAGGVAESRHAWSLVAAACLAAFVGSFFGARLVKKVTMKHVRAVVGIGLVLFALAIGGGII